MKLMSKFGYHSSRLVIIFILTLIISCSGRSLKITPKPCTNALGEEGTCMFVWECIKTEGKHLGTCVDGFLFGSCCAHNDTYNSIDAVPITKPSALSIIHSSFVESFSPNISSSIQYNPIIKPEPLPFFSHSSTNRPSTWPTPKPNLSSLTTKAPLTTSKPVNSWTTQKPWSSQPSPISSQPKPPMVFQNFRPPIFSIFGTHRPQPIFLRPTFRPPINRPSIFSSSIQNTPIHSSIINKPSITQFKPYSEIYTTTRTPSYMLSNSYSGTTQSLSIMSSSISVPAANTPLTSSTKIVTNFTTTTTTPKPVSSIGSLSEIKPNNWSTKDVQCGVPTFTHKAKVVGGKNAAFGAYPWQVSVRRTSFFGFSSTHRCGGAILNNQWIATAGHCVDDLLLSQIRIRVGEYDFANVLEPYSYVEKGAKRKVVHPNYNFFTYENDLALVQVDEPIEFQPHIAPICLPPEKIEMVGRNATVTGWGRLSEGGILPSILQEVKVPIVSNDKCKTMFMSAGRHEYIPEIFMCAGYEEGGRDSCQGDSGGPLQVQGDDGKWFLAGIISWGIGCAEPNLPGVCTRISRFKDWMIKTIS